STVQRCRCCSDAGRPMPDRVRVLLVLGPTTGGVGRHVHAIAGELIGRGHDVSIVGPAVTDELFDWAGLGARFVAAPVGRVVPRRLAAAVPAVGAEGTNAGGVHP